MLNPLSAPRYFKKRRFKIILKHLGLRDTEEASDSKLVRILDVGCGSHGRNFEVFLEDRKDVFVVGIDLIRRTNIKMQNFEFIRADASKMPFRSKSFDHVVSIGVFEHITPLSKLAQASVEVKRVVKKSFAVVVPSIRTLIEPHFQAPLMQLLSYNVKRALIRHVTIGNYRKNSSGKFEKLNYLSDDAWLNVDGFTDSSVKRFFYIPLLVENLLIYKKLKEEQDEGQDKLG